MSKIALIIGFQYEDSLNPGRSYLPGTLVDIYRIYKIISDSFDKINIISDVEFSPQDLYILNEKGIVDPDIYSLDQEITPYSGRSQVSKYLEEVLQAKYGLFYFSGHSTGTKLLLPGTDHINETDIYTHMSKVRSPDVETIMIYDCCHGHNFLLPYIYNGNSYHLVDSTKLYYPHRILSICASTSNQVSYSDEDGSVLTKSLYKHLRNDKPITNLHELYRQLVVDIESSSGTRPEIYSSYPNIYYLWPWFLKNISWTIDYDPYSGKLRIVI